MDIYSPNLVNFGPRFPQYHVATCTSPSLIQLCYVSINGDK